MSSELAGQIVLRTKDAWHLMTTEIDISIVIPALNEAKRLPLTLDSLVNQHEGFPGIRIGEVIVVDDGSSDETSVVAKSFADKLPGVIVEILPVNRGKGFAVRRGIEIATSEWILVADADMSTPWDQMSKLVSHVADGSFDIAIGSRGLSESDVTTRQSFIREHLGKSFNVLIRMLTRLPFSDTQCGFKLARRRGVIDFAGKLQIDRFAWDVEFLILAQDHGMKVVEVPVSWEHRDASRVNPLFDGFDMAKAVVSLQLRRLFRRS
ncbi:MAG: dolichyl-phosphate beta-glucosyltransferase [Planctomycetota bacterium]